MKFAHKSLLQAVLLAALPCLSHAEILLQNAGEPIPDIMLRTSQAPSRVIPFTNFAKEQQNILNSLPCKWVSQNGRLGRIESNQRYDFLCKGGIWGTISLFLNQSPSFENGISNLRLHYRAWNPEAHPSAGEAAEAQKFLQHVVARFVPANLAEWTLESFWGTSARRWEGQGVLVTYEHEEQPTFAIHKLEITGTGRSLSDGQIPLARPANLPTAQTPSQAQAEATGGLLNPAVRIRMDVTPTTPSTSLIQWKAPAAITPTLPLPQALATPLPLARAVSGLAVPPQVPSSTVDMLKAWVTAKPKDPTPTLISATAAELNTRPAPESQSPTTPPPPINSKLVPNAADTINSRPKAPSNFDAYNRAEQLTRSVEERAQITGAKPNTPATPQQTLMKDQPAPSLPAVPTPNSQPTTNTVTIQPKQTLRQPPARPLPQLKFIPAAEPLAPATSPITFEDEKSAI